MIYKQIYSYSKNRLNGYSFDLPRFEWVETPDVKWSRQAFINKGFLTYADRRAMLEDMNHKELFQIAYPANIINTLPWVLEYYEGKELADAIIDVLRINLIDIANEYKKSKSYTFDILKDVNVDEKITKLQHKHIIKYLKPWRMKNGGPAFGSMVCHMDREHKDIYISARHYFWTEGVVPTIYVSKGGK